MRTLIAAIATAAALASPAAADIEHRSAQGSVDEVFGRLVEAVNAAGATIFAEIDHGAGAADADMELAPSRLLVFGNPQLGTPVMQADIEAGLFLPLEMLVYEEGGETYIAYREVEDRFDDVDVDDDLDVLGRMAEALDNLASAAAAP